MIEPAYADKFGITADFPAHNKSDAERFSASLTAQGIHHVCVVLRFSVARTEAGAAWYHWLLPYLQASHTVLVRVVYDPALTVRTAAEDAAFRRFIERILPQMGGSIDAVELCIPALDGWGATLLHTAANLVRASGKMAVLGIPPDATPAWLNAVGDHDLLGAVGAIGLHCEAHQPASWHTAMQETARHYNARIVTWATGVFCNTAGDDEAAEAHAMLQSLEWPVERIYWNSCIAGADEECCTLFTGPAQQPNLLGRLLAKGVEGLARALVNPAPAVLARRPVLVTGGAGFIGANLADRLARNGHDVHIYDALARPGVERNLEWLKANHPRRIAVTIADLRDEPALTDAVRGASAVFHLAAQVAVTTSLIRPVQDFDVNVRATLTVLEAIRRYNPSAPLLYASTNKVYGDLADVVLVRRGQQYVPANHALHALGIDESRPLCFHTPYGCSKGAADQYVLDYAHTFGLHTAVLRMSCIYGERQFGTEDQGWLAHFLLRAIAGESLTLYGDGCQVRDVLHIDDAVDAYIGAWENIGSIAGRAYNLGGGPANAISLLQLIAHIEHLLGRTVGVEFEDWRAGDQRYFVADATALRTVLHLNAPMDWREGVARLCAHFGAPALVPQREAAL